MISGDLTSRTAKVFKYQWERFSALPLEKYEEEFLSYLDPLGKNFFSDKVVLDAGCGSGKFSYWAAQYGARIVIGVDFSDSVKIARKLTRGLSNVQIINANLYNLPFKNEFDLIYSIGVLHHLPDPQEGFKQLVTNLKNGGGIFAWVYAKEGNILYITFAEPIRKLVTARLPLLMNEFIARVIASILWTLIIFIYLPVNRFNWTKKVTQYLPWNDYFLYFYKLGYNFFVVTIFDKLIPPIAHYYTKEEFTGWFRENDLQEIKVWQRNGNSWCGYGRKK
jgi:SAM-dependent methyltransferase